MKKKIVLACIGFVVLVGILAGIKALQFRIMIADGSEFDMGPTRVTTATVRTVDGQG
jgi:hypothetical protein